MSKKKVAPCISERCASDTNKVPSSLSSSRGMSFSDSRYSSSSSLNEASREPLSSWHLEYVKMTHFGRFANTIVGPFKPGMNVVYGPNEAGKTTITELIKGVFFGWPHARGTVNSYRPENADRIGSLFFKNADTSQTVELKRIKNTGDLNPPSSLLSDIDQDTYETMFALTSDELLRLDRHDEVTAHLLTAGSGTSSSPAHALEIVDERIKQALSRSSHYPQSIPHLKAEQERLKDLLRKGAEEAKQFRIQEKTLADLELRRETLTATHEALNTEIEDLTTLRTTLMSIDEARETAQAHLQETIVAKEEADRACQVPLDEEVRPLVSLTKMEEYHLRDSLDDLDEKRIKLEHALDNARRDANTSQVDYEATKDDAQANAQYARARTQRKARLVIALFIPLVMIALGLFVVASVYTSGGRLSYMVAGAALVLFALVIAAAGIARGSKPSHIEEVLEEERTKKAWVAQQDQKAVEVCQREVDDHQRRITVFLEEQGLAAAQGSLRRARRLLDKAREDQVNQEADRQRYRALALKETTLEHDLHALSNQRVDECHKRGFSRTATLADIDAELERKNTERDQTLRLAKETEHGIGELKTILSTARHLSAFNENKLEAEVIETQLNEAYYRLATLFIARNSLAQAVTQWERKSQPEVYRSASRLCALMTNDAWQCVRMNAQGDIEVVDALKTSRSPHLLSLGTRQQLYLSLRIALLLTAENVGRGLPILCDDILVNFDDTRRERAALALMELARKRQVILFTCHSDIASLVCKVDPSSNLLEL